MSDFMELLVLVGQRKCRYEGEYAPEAFEVIDGWGDEDNPDFLEEAQAKAVATGEFDSVIVMTVRVPFKDVMARLFPARNPIDGKVTG